MALIVIAIRVVFRSVFATGVTPARPRPVHAAARAHARTGTPASSSAARCRWRRRCRPTFDGLRLGTLLCCIGAANVLANPKRALRVLPGALYELGVAVVVALSVAPQLVESAQRVRRARRLRAGGGKGLRGAARRSPSRCSRTRWSARCSWPPAMDSRGYGRTGTGHPRQPPAAPPRCCCWAWCGLCAGVVRAARRHRAAAARPARPSLAGAAAVLRRAARSAAGGCAAPPTGPTRGGRRSGSSPAAACAAPRVLFVQRRLRRRRPQPVAVPAALAAAAAACRSLGILLAGLAALRRAAAGAPRAGRRTATGRRPRRPSARRWPRDRLRPGQHHLRRRAAAGAARRRPARRRGRAVPGRRPHRRRASPPCSARSTGWSRTSPAARWPAGSASTGATPPTTRRASSPTSSAWSGQDPLAGFVTDTVEEELAYGMEQLAVAAGGHAQAGRGDPRPARPGRPAPPGAARAVRRPAAAGGHRLGADRPPAGARARRADLRARPDRGRGGAGRRSPGWCTTSASPCVLAEHRLERVVQYADRVLHLPGDGTVDRRAAGADVRDDRRSRRRSSSSAGSPAGARCRCRCATPGAGPADAARRDRARPPCRRRASCPAGGRRVGAARPRGVVVRYGDVVAVREVDLDLHGRAGHRADGPQRVGQVVAAVGAAGLRAAAGAAGSTSAARDPARRCPPAAGPAAGRARAADAGRPALPDDRRAPSWRRPTASRAAARAERPRRCSTGSRPASPDDMHPRDLSEGQRLGLVLAIQLRATPAGRAARRADPRPGLPGQAGADPHRRRAGRRGPRVVVSTHDVEFVAAAADRVVVLAEGEIVADGPTTDVIVASPAFAPQMAKILAPLPYLTVAQVAAALAGRRRERRDRRRAPPPIRVPRRTVAHASRWRRSSASSRSCGRSSSPRARSATPTLAAADVRRAARARRSPSCSPRSPTAASTPRRSRCSACCRRSTPRCARSAPGTAGIETVFFLLVLAGRVFGPGLRVRARLHLAVRVGADHRRRRAVDAVPDVRLRLGRAVRRAAAAGPRPGRAADARRLRRGGRLLLRLHAQPVVLAVLARSGQLDRLPARARRSPSSGTATCVFDATTSLGWDTGRAVTNFVLHPARRAGRAGDAAPGRPAGRVRGAGRASRRRHDADRLAAAVGHRDRLRARAGRRSWSA